MSETQTTPRIAPVQDPDEAQRTELHNGPQLDGKPMHVFATLAHAPTILSACNALGKALQVDSPLSFRQRELVIVRTAALAGSDYELFHHLKLGATAGLTDDELAAAADVDSQHAWAPDDAALLRVADEISTTVDVSDEAWAALDPALDDAGRISLLALIGFFRLVGGVLNGARVQLEGD